MTWGNYKTYLVERLKADFSVPYDISDSANYAVGQPFDTRAAQHLSLFTRETFCLYLNRGTLALAGQQGNQEVNLRTVAPKPVFEVERLVINSQEVSHHAAGNLIDNLQRTLTERTPTLYGISGPYKLIFNSLISADDVSNGGWICGYYTEPAPTLDANALEIDDDYLEAASMFSAAHFMENVAKGEDEGKRLAYYKRTAQRNVKEIKAEMLERHNRSY